MHNSFLKWKEIPVKDLHQMISNITNTILNKRIFNFWSRLKQEKSKTWKQMAEVFLLENELGSVAQRDKIPKRCHLRKIVLKEFLMKLSQQSYELLTNMFNCAPMEKYEVNTLVPLQISFSHYDSLLPELSV